MLIKLGGRTAKGRLNRMLRTEAWTEEEVTLLRSLVRKRTHPRIIVHFLCRRDRDVRGKAESLGLSIGRQRANPSA